MTSPSRIVWLASYPKSGNTWFRALLANLAGGAETPLDINALSEQGGAIASARAPFDDATMISSSLLTPDEADHLRPRVYETIAAEADRLCYVKVHDAYTLTKAGEPLLGRSLARGAIYIARDPRDVAVSFAYHSDTTVDAAIERMNDPHAKFSGGRHGQTPQLRQRLLDWSGHVVSWLDQRFLPVLLVRYEDLHAAPVETLTRALRFVGEDASRADAERAVRHADFAELQRQEKEKGFVERKSHATLFFRQGRVGAWRDMLTPAQAASIVGRHRTVMARIGYDCLATEAAP